MKITAQSTDEAVLAYLGERLARCRLNRNRTQSEVAAEAGVSKRTVERLETGHSAQLSSLIRVLRALGLLGNLDRLVPEPLPSPMQQLELQGRIRERASKPRAAPQAEDRKWTWGDES